MSEGVHPLNIVSARTAPLRDIPSTPQPDVTVKPGPAARASTITRAERFQAWRAEGPRTFEALHDRDGALRGDVVTALWQRIEQLLPAAPEPSQPPNDGTLTDLDLHALSEKLTRAEKLLGKQDSAERRAVQALRTQVLGARADLARPLMLATASAQSEQYAQAGTTRTLLLEKDFAIPALPLAAHLSPLVGATYTSGVAVGDDLWITESAGVEARLGIVARIKLFFLKLDLGLIGRHRRTKGRLYFDQNHFLRAPGSSQYRATRHVGLLRGFKRALTPARLRQPLSLARLDKLRLRADEHYDEFAQAAAMLGVVIHRSRADVAHHPLAATYLTAPAAGLPSKTVTTSVKIQGSATLSATGEAGLAGLVGANAHGTAEIATQRMALRTFVPLWDALDCREARRAGSDVTLKRLRHLRAAAPPLALAALSAADLAGTLQALQAELELYCHAARSATRNRHAHACARSIEQAWGVNARAGACGYLRALAITTALLGQQARATGQKLPAAYDDLTRCLTAPPLRHDPVKLKRATGIKDSLLIDTRQHETVVDAQAGLSTPAWGVGVAASGKVRGSRTRHFNMLKSGDFIDAEASVGLTGSLRVGNVVEPITKWISDQLGSGVDGLVEAGLPADLGSYLGEGLDELVNGIVPTLKGGAHLVVAMKYSKPLADGGASAADAAAARHDQSATPAFNLEYLRVLLRVEAPMSSMTYPLATLLGKNAIRTVLMRLENCYAKDDDRLRGRRDALAYLQSRSVRRDLPALLANLAREDSAATRQVRAFVRTALAHADDESAADDLRACEEAFFRVMRVYAKAAASVVQPFAFEVPAGHPVAAGPDLRDPRLHALPAYAAAEQALLDLIKAMMEPARGYRGKHISYATRLGNVG
ncbi:hypothetical protein [Bordetella sp. N]|uniref:hypothetical protein n=1 Tax=Bordetella sp. N TaxID=1746199 RepID=UPI00070EE10D|nr:hypothetical protein [Bordetella sp. N]ALM86266.1 hypothetical protein ASB57_27955 [Bordetella sp. N]